MVSTWTDPWKRQVNDDLAVRTRVEIDAVEALDAVRSAGGVCIPAEESRWLQWPSGRGRDARG